MSVTPEFSRGAESMSQKENHQKRGSRGAAVSKGDHSPCCSNTEGPCSHPRKQRFIFTLGRASRRVSCPLPPFCSPLSNQEALVNTYQLVLRCPPLCLPGRGRTAGLWTSGEVRGAKAYGYCELQRILKSTNKQKTNQRTHQNRILPTS